MTMNLNMGIEIFSLTKKTALITGGGTGIGLGIAKAMIAAGATVVITGRDADKLLKAQKKLGDNCFYFVFDVTQKAAIPHFINEIENAVAPIDILVNNAGIHLKKWALDTSDAEFENIIQTNLLSVFGLSKACAKKMSERTGGTILFIGSMAGIFGIDRVAAYGTSKAALTGLMHSLVTEFSTYNIRINTIVPGWIESPMFLNAVNSDPLRKQKITSRIAMDSFGTPADIGYTAVFLSSTAARYITGVVLPVDGGAAINF
ncbi:SDR family oxidoreductase [Pedobacter psychrodurus]|uniref:SDR family NAD(P)-dependent oxidoreductase n=1 Tax=Pedobacter psychrodurus TaxID=2530456 RepID=UPI00292D0286|nr:SDR family oxidoreductase [Pedobacter psychrodurus]